MDRGHSLWADVMCASKLLSFAICRVYAADEGMPPLFPILYERENPITSKAITALSLF